MNVTVEKVEPVTLPKRDARASIKETAQHRILIIDGAMGTQIQNRRLDEAAYRGERFKDWPSDLKGNNDLLNLTQPDIIREIHEEYLRPAPTSSRRTPSPRTASLRRTTDRRTMPMR